jgi:hypothetical protein
MPFNDYSTPNTDMIDNFPERMDRFLNCISQVYFQQDSFDAIFSSTDKTGGKNLLRNYEMEMAKKKAAYPGASGSKDPPPGAGRQMTDVDG